MVGELRLAQPGGPAGPGATAAAGAGLAGAGSGGATAAAISPPALVPCPTAVPTTPPQPSAISHPTVPVPHRFSPGPVPPGAGTVPPPPPGPVLPGAGTVPPPPLGPVPPGAGTVQPIPPGPVLPGAGTVPPPSMADLVPATLAFRQGEGIDDLLGEGVSVLGLPTAALSHAAAAAAVGPAGADQPVGGALGPDVSPLLGDDRQVGLGEPSRTWGGNDIGKW